MDFFQRVGNFFSGKGWVSDDERRRKEQQVQAPVQPRPQPLQQVQQPNINRLNGLSGVNTPGLGGGTNIFSQAQQKVNPNPLQQANQATQQLNQNNQPKPLIPEKTVNDAPKVLTPQGQQDWVNKENKQIQIQNVINNPTQVLKTQVQQQQPKPAPVAIQPQQQNRPQIAPSFPNPVRNPLFTQNQDSLTRALDIAKQESDKYKADQAARNDKLDNIMRARGVSEPEIAKNRQVRIDAENRAYLSEDKARRDSNIAQMAGLATLPVRSVVSFTKGAIDGAGRTVGDSGDAWALDIADALYAITGDERYARTRKYIVEQGKQRNAQYDQDMGIFKKNDTDVALAHEAGQGAQRLAQDAATYVATGGTLPAARAFAEHSADFITKANANGKGTREMLPYAYFSGGVQALIEKAGIDKVLSPLGKTRLGKLITGGLAEGLEESTQQFAENAIAKHTYDPNRKYDEGVFKSGLMGTALGGPTGMANFGAMRQTGNQPSSAMTARMNQNEATGKLEKEAIAQRQARQSSDDTSLKQAAEVNVANNQNNQLHPIQSVNVAPAVENTIPNASPALKQAVTQNMSDIQHGDVNAVATRQQTTGILENYLIEQATKNIQDLSGAFSGVKGAVRNKINPYGDNGVVINRLNPKQMKYNVAEAVGSITGDARKRLSQAAFGDLQKARTGNPYRTSDGMDVELSRQGNRKFTNPRARATNENFTVKQRLAPYIDQVIEKSRLIDSAQDRSGHGVADGGFEYRELPVKYRGNDYTATLDIAKSNDHGRNTLYEGNIRKAPVSPGELIEPGYNTEASTRNIAQEAQNVNEDVKYKLNPEHEAQVRAYNEHITRLRQHEEYLRGQGMSENAPAMINLRKAQEQAIYARDHIGEVDKLGNVLAYDISGIRKSTGRGLDGSAISADALDQSIDNSSIPNNPQDVNTDNRYQHPLQETINEMEANPKPKMTRELREAIDEFIYENIDHNLFNNNAIVLELSVEMAGNHTLLEEEHVHIMVE